MNMINRKREELEEQQLHLNVGLKKIHETEEQVTALQGSLREKGKELEEKNALANEKLKQMVHDQQEAEVKQQEALKLRAELEERDKVPRIHAMMFF